MILKISSKPFDLKKFQRLRSSSRKVSFECKALLEKLPTQFLTILILLLPFANAFQCDIVRDTNKCTDSNFQHYDNNHCIIGVISDDNGHHMDFKRNMYTLDNYNEKELARHSDCLGSHAICNMLEKTWSNHTLTKPFGPCHFWSPSRHGMTSHMEVDQTDYFMCQKFIGIWTDMWLACADHEIQTHSSSRSDKPKQAAIGIVSTLGILLTLYLFYKLHKKIQERKQSNQRHVFSNHMSSSSDNSETDSDSDNSVV